MFDKEAKQKIKIGLLKEIKTALNEEVVIRMWMVGNPKMRQQAQINSFLIDKVVDLQYQIDQLKGK